MVARSSGISANFLCDNSKYMLGADRKGSGKREKECFEAPPVFLQWEFCSDHERKVLHQIFHQGAAKSVL
ncbi:MAG: hypothetical protein SOW08_04725 [Lachnospiraceae bacterium]|nr:hypothetical protein [Lachnospiraceae bacterium]